MSVHLALPFHEGEIHLHKTLRVPTFENPTSPFLTPFAARILPRSPVVAFGALDTLGRPWTTLWGGEDGFCRPVASSIVAVKSNVGRAHDPVVEALLGFDAAGELVQHGEGGPLMSGLGINYDTRSRIKFSGRMVAGALQASEEDSGAAELQLVMKIETSLGNCPKYVNRKTIIPALPSPTLLSTSTPLIPAAISLINTADHFFLSSAHPTSPSTNHRGGPPGFLRILSNTPSELSLIYPEYSGNNLYQTLGNFHLSPLASLLIPDLATGNALYLTGRVSILYGQAASAILPHTPLAVKFTVSDLRLVASALPFRAINISPSPYNPRLRLLANERPPPTSSSSSSSLSSTATLLSQTPLSQTISRFRFRLDKPVTHSAGQYVVFDFSDEFDIGYSHMRDDDPTSLNDDFIRTFTVSSAPSSSSSSSSASSSSLKTNEFEITIRKVGRATTFLAKQPASSRLTIPVSGFGGEFVLDPASASAAEEGATKTERKTVFIAAGVGITPFLSMMGSKIQPHTELFWSVRAADLGLIKDTLDHVEGLGAALRVFVTGAETAAPSGLAVGVGVDKSELFARITKEGGEVWERRMEREDLVSKTTSTSTGEGKGEEEERKLLLCAGKGFRGEVLGWLEGEKVLFEDFDF